MIEKTFCMFQLAKSNRALHSKCANKGGKVQFKVKYKYYHHNRATDSII